jgi:hypothetical protein
MLSPGGPGEILMTDTSRGAVWQKISGDATLSSTGVLTLSDIGVIPNSYHNVFVDPTGRVYGGTNPTTLFGYQITDAVQLSPSAGAQQGYVNVTGALISASYISGLNLMTTNSVQAGTDSIATNDFKYASAKTVTKNIAPFAFTPAPSSAGLATYGGEYVYATASAAPSFMHDLSTIVPNGATIQSLRVFRYDNDTVSDANVYVGLNWRPASSTSSSSRSIMCSTLTGATANIDTTCQLVVSPTVTVNYANNVYWVYAGYTGGMPADGGNIRFYGLSVTYTTDRLSP